MKLRLEIVVAIGAAAVGGFLLYQNYSAAQAAREALSGGDDFKVPGKHIDMPMLPQPAADILAGAWAQIVAPKNSAVWTDPVPPLEKNYNPLP